MSHGVLRSVSRRPTSGGSGAAAVASLRRSASHAPGHAPSPAPSPVPRPAGGERSVARPRSAAPTLGRKARKQGRTASGPPPRPHTAAWSGNADGPGSDSAARQHVRSELRATHFAATSPQVNANGAYSLNAAPFPGALGRRATHAAASAAAAAAAAATASTLPSSSSGKLARRKAASRQFRTTVLRVPADPPVVHLMQQDHVLAQSRGLAPVSRQPPHVHSDNFVLV